MGETNEKTFSYCGVAFQIEKNTELFPAKAMYVIWRQAEKKV